MEKSPSPSCFHARIAWTTLNRGNSQGKRFDAAIHLANAVRRGCSGCSGRLVLTLLGPVAFLLGIWFAAPYVLVAFSDVMKGWHIFLFVLLLFAVTAFLGARYLPDH